MKPYLIDDADAFDERGILRDGHGITVKMMTRDGVNSSLSPLQRAVVENGVRPSALHDGRNNPVGNRPGFIVSTDSALNDARTIRDAEYQRYQDRVGNAWRGNDADVTNEAAPAAEGSSCTVRGQLYPNDVGKPGTLQRVDGALVCVPSNPTNADATTDPRIVAYDSYDRDLTTAWKGNR